MKHVLFVISMIMTLHTAQAQYVSYDSLVKSIKAVNVQKTVVEDHMRLIGEVDSLHKELQRENYFYTACQERNTRLNYALRLYKVLDEIEGWDTAKNKAQVISQASFIKYDTLADGSLGYMNITFYDQDPFDNIDKLEFEIEEHIAGNSSWLQSRYPKTSSKIRQQIIRIEKRPIDFAASNQVQRIVFPSLIVKANNVSDKQKFAGLYFNCIEEVCKDPKMQEYSINEYIRYETKAVPDHNIDKILAIRVAFIKVLKDAYAKKNPY